MSGPKERVPLGKRIFLFGANLLIIVGLIITVGVAGLYGWGLVEEQRAALESEIRQQELAHEVASAAEPDVTEATPVPTEVPRDLPARATPTGTGVRTIVPTPLPTPTPSPRPARRIIIPRIDVESDVVESEIKNGEWQVPKFVVGHLQGTANAGWKGNAVFAGHLLSLSSGNVFARIGEMEQGDLIYIVTANAKYLYEVTRVRNVANTDLSVVQPTADATVTLITCAGTWDFVKRDYLERTIVEAKLREDGPPTARNLPQRLVN